MEIAENALTVFEALSPSWQLFDAQKTAQSLRSLQRLGFAEVADDDGETVLVRLSPEGVEYRDHVYLRRAQNIDSRARRGLLSA